MTNDTIDAAAEARLIRIMRYRDGRLTQQEAEAVAAEIAADPAAAEYRRGLLRRRRRGPLRLGRA